MLFFSVLIVAVDTSNLALAEKGELQCYRPDVQKKTCQSIASYQLTGVRRLPQQSGGAVSNEATPNARPSSSRARCLRPYPQTIYSWARVLWDRW